jgi:hypothetical protein
LETFFEAPIPMGLRWHRFTAGSPFEENLRTGQFLVTLFAAMKESLLSAYLTRPSSVFHPRWSYFSSAVSAAVGWFSGVAHPIITIGVKRAQIVASNLMGKT